MKFDYILGNPPYQEDTEGTSDKPLYHTFMDATYELADKVMLITPGRFLFNAGKTPKEWNQKMLSDPHLKVESYEQDSTRVFPNASIMGGVVITYHDKTKEFEPIEVFSSFAEIRSMIVKISNYVHDTNISDIMFLQNRFNLDKLYKDYPEFRSVISSNGNERRIVSSAFNKLSVFHVEHMSDKDIQLLGIAGTNKREYRYILKDYVEDNGNLTHWKVLVPKSNGSGAIGEVVPTCLIGEPVVVAPNIGYTQSFIGIGAFDTRDEAENCLKYVKSKFARTMLGILKITQDNPPEKWKYVPLQDFTTSSDLDWTASIPDIDQQLYRKYNLDQSEIDFIESHVKPME